ncbi:MAG TPA: SGNH/GDSL hydrolase family protein [Lacipirellulaceae bacterium]|nr:SGNH/GDSL hydrolase family protein [Lacipirellulaceae bacterium]
MIGVIRWKLGPAACVFAVLFAGHALNAQAGPFSDLVVFGDSLSDMGNVSDATGSIPFIATTPGPYYYNGRFSNGPIYAESLAAGLGLPSLDYSRDGGNDFAYGGAQTSGTSFPYNVVVRDIDDQVGDFLKSRTASANELFLIFAGANDLIDGQTNVNVPVNNLSQDLGRLFAGGARQFLVLNLPLLGYTPRYNTNSTLFAQANAITEQFNAALDTMLDSFQSSNPAANVYRLDIAALVGQVIANPQSFGLINVTDSAAPGLSPGESSYDTSHIVADPNQYLFWDDLHPTAAVHAILGERAVQLFFEPGDFNHDAKVDAADYVVWRKGLSAGYIASDYDVWRNHLGETAASGRSSATTEFRGTPVPEPASMILALIGMACINKGRVARVVRLVGSSPIT